MSEQSKTPWKIVYRRAIQDDGSLLFPERLTQEFLDQARRTLGAYQFANQYQNECVPDSEKSFKPHWLRYFSTVPVNTYRFAFVDPAIGQKKHHDYTGIVVVDVDEEGTWYLRVANRYRITPTEIVSKLFEIQKEWGCRAIGVEVVAYQEALLYMLDQECRKRNELLPIKGITRKATSKQTRILGLVPRFEWGRVYLARGLKDFEDEYAMFPRGAHDDLCFVAGTQIATPNGSRPIESLKRGDLVLTPFGSRRVVSTGSRVTEVISRHGLTGTPNHPMITRGNALKSLDSVTCLDELSILSCREWIRLNVLELFTSMGLSTPGLPTRDAITSQRAQRIASEGNLRVFMSLFMSFLAANEYRRAITFTTKTATRLTTALKTWSVYRLKCITECLKTGTWLRLGQIWREFAQWLPNGTNLLPAESGIAITGRTRSEKSGQSPSSALFAGKSDSLRDPRKPGSAPPLANKSYPEDRNGLMFRLSALFAGGAFQRTGGLPLKPAGLSVKFRPTAQRVYNITVETDHLYYANGFLVSNCDALASLEELVYTPEKEKAQPLEKPHSPHDANHERWVIQQMVERQRSAQDDESF